MRQPAPGPDRDAVRTAEAGLAELGSSKNQRETRTALSGRTLADDQHGACSARSPRPGQAQGKGRRNRATGTALSRPLQPNDLWCADYKGEFMLAARRYCYPLTITDFASRYLFACEALATTKEVYAFPVFEASFKEFGLPRTIRRHAGSNHLRTPSGQKCYPCLRYETLPMCPERTGGSWRTRQDSNL